MDADTPADTSAASSLLPSQPLPATSDNLAEAPTTATPTAHTPGTNSLALQPQSSQLATADTNGAFGIRAPVAQGLKYVCTGLRTRIELTLGHSLTSAIRVFVGKGSNVREFCIHESLAIRHSAFFATAAEERKKQPGHDDNVEEDRKELQRWSVTRKEDDPEHFEMFARFLYSGKAYSRMDGDRSSADGKIKDTEFSRLFFAWKLGGRLQSPSFKDAMVDAICDKISQEKVHPTDSYRAIYPHTSTGAPLRRLIVDIAVWFWQARNFGETTFHESWNEFFRDLALRQHEVGKNGGMGPAPFESPSCNYHEHGDDSPCYKTMF